MPSSQARAASSPSLTRSAVTHAWNEPFVGAQASRPRHLRVRQIEDRVRQLRRVERVGVVDQHARAAGESKPLPLA